MEQKGRYYFSKLSSRRGASTLSKTNPGRSDSFRHFLFQSAIKLCSASPASFEN
jgi:hypothetical protein